MEMTRFIAKGQYIQNVSLPIKLIQPSFAYKASPYHFAEKNSAAWGERAGQANHFSKQIGKGQVIWHVHS